MVASLIMVFVGRSFGGVLLREVGRTLGVEEILNGGERGTLVRTRRGVIFMPILVLGFPFSWLLFSC